MTDRMVFAIALALSGIVQAGCGSRSVIGEGPSGGCTQGCAANQVCAGGVCQASCPAGTTNCARTCVETASDRNNCGSCGASCPSNEVCANSGCAVTCPMGLADCSGSCVSFASDPYHCGGCDTLCAAGHACVGAVCQ